MTFDLHPNNVQIFKKLKEFLEELIPKKFNDIDLGVRH